MKLIRGTLDVLILQVLSHGPLHGYGIADRIRRLSDDVLQIEDGALYQALHRMRDRGWVQAEWGTTADGHRAKFYELTRAGRDHLAKEQTGWKRYTEAVAKVFGWEGGSVG